MRGFHRHRGNRWSPRGLYRRTWALLDGLPLPPWVDRTLRLGAYGLRKARFRWTIRHARREPVRYGGGAVSRSGVLASRTSFQPLPLAEAASWFGALHDANERVHLASGSWARAPGRHPAGRGVAVEAVAFRVLGYLDAHEATGCGAYAARAEAGAEYLLRERAFCNGHLLLQDHLVPDIPYALAGLAFLELWRRAPSPPLLEAARRIGDRLLDYPIAGSVNHACAPVWLLAPLYRHTGDERYLRGALRRVRRTALAFQLPYGGWHGHEAWTWYHAIATKALVEAYASTPFQPPHYPLKDRLAGAIAAALNRLVLAQDETGRIEPVGALVDAQDSEKVSRLWTRSAVGWGGEPPRLPVRPEAGGYEMDALVTAHLMLGVVAEPAHGLAHHLVRLRYTGRLELDTYAAGRYLGLLARSVPVAGGAGGDGAAALPGARRAPTVLGVPPRPGEPG